MIWVERFDGRLQRADSLHTALDEPVRAWWMEAQTSATPAAPAGRPTVERTARLDPTPVRGVPAELLATAIERPGRALRRRPSGRRGSLIERALGLDRG